MKIMVSYASRHGATAGIAQRIADVLAGQGHAVDCTPVAAAGDPAGYDAVVIGGAAYLAHWLKEAAGFVRRHHTALAERPVWLFSSGPLGTAAVDAEGADVLASTRPKEFPELVELIHPRDAAVFFGAYDPDARPATLLERLTQPMVASRGILPAGDFRDWAAIEAWARGIADELSPQPTA